MVLQQYVSLSFLQTGSNQQLSYASRDVPVIKTMLLAQCSLCSSINQFKPLRHVMVANVERRGKFNNSKHIFPNNYWVRIWF